MLCKITISNCLLKIRGGQRWTRTLWPNVRYADTLILMVFCYRSVYSPVRDFPSTSRPSTDTLVVMRFNWKVYIDHFGVALKMILEIKVLPKSINIIRLVQLNLSFRFLIRKKSTCSIGFNSIGQSKYFGHISAPEL